MHTIDADERVEVDAAPQLDETIASAELFLRPGARHLSADNSLPDYDENAAALLTERVLSFLDTIE
jgi:dienelactone hydrolase